MKNIVLLIIAGVAFIWGFYIYAFVYDISWLKSFYFSLSLFFVSLTTAQDLGIDLQEAWYQNIYIPAILAALVLVGTVVLLYVRLLHRSFKKFDRVLLGNNTVVIGLGEGNRAYIESEPKAFEKKIIVIEADKNNPYIEQYRKKVLVEVADASQPDVLKSLQIEKQGNIVISTGKDIDNINIAKQILKLDSDAKIFLHLNDRKLRNFHKKDGVLSEDNIRVFSYYEESARELFVTHDIDGDSTEIIQSDEPYCIAVVSNTLLAHEVVAQACIVGQLPNGNALTIYCIDKDAKKFQNALELEFPGINEVPHVTVRYIEADPKTTVFYDLDVWGEPNLTHIIFCNEDDQYNLDVAVTLTNCRFLEASVDHTLGCKMHIAMSDSTVLGEHIENNSKLFDHMCIFAQTQKVSHRDYIIGEKRDAQAIATDVIYDTISPVLMDYDHYQYSFQYYTNETYDNASYMHFTADNWVKLQYFFKESNRAVADHMKTKLKYLGLKLQQNDENKQVLYTKNREIFEEKLQKHLVTLARCEHDRWMAFHYLQGYRPMPFISKKEKKDRKEELENKRLHMCLVPFESFKERTKELEALGYQRGQFEGYDVMIVTHIPQILTYAGYELKEIDHA